MAMLDAVLGKAAEIPDAIRKGKEDAMKNIVYVERNDVDSLYHGINWYVRKRKRNDLCRLQKVLVLIAGGPARAVLELAGIQKHQNKIT